MKGNRPCRSAWRSLVPEVAAIAAATVLELPYLPRKEDTLQIPHPRSEDEITYLVHDSKGKSFNSSHHGDHFRLGQTTASIGEGDEAELSNGSSLSKGLYLSQQF